MNILLVGGCGYVGGYLTDKLILNGHDVVIYDNLMYESRFLKKVPFEGTIRNDKILFSESNSRIIVEVSAKKKKEFEEAMKGCVFSEIGHVSAGKNLAINGVEGKILIQEDSETLKRTWKKTLGW